jgi:hypothetical protein
MKRPHRFSTAAALAFVALATVGGSPKAALAQPSVADIAGAKKLFADGRADELAARYDEGLKKFERVQLLQPRGGVMFHIAFCHEKLGHVEAAVEGYEKAMEMAKAENKPDVIREAQNRLGPLVARLPKLSVIVPAGTKDVRITLDDKPLAESEWNQEKRVSLGAHKIEAFDSTSAQPVFHVAIDTPERARAEVRVVLPTHAPPPVAVVTPPPVAPPAEPPAKPAATEPARAPEKTPYGPRDLTSSSRPNYTLPVITTVATGVFLGVGIAAFAIAGGEQKTMLESCPVLLPDDCETQKKSVRTWDTVSLVGFGAAGVGLVTSIVLFATQASKSSNAASAPSFRVGGLSLVPSATLSRDGAGLSLGGTL